MGWAKRKTIVFFEIHLFQPPGGPKMPKFGTKNGIFSFFVVKGSFLHGSSPLLVCKLFYVKEVFLWKSIFRLYHDLGQHNFSRFSLNFQENFFMALDDSQKHFTKLTRFWRGLEDKPNTLNSMKFHPCYQKILYDTFFPLILLIWPPK